MKRKLVRYRQSCSSPVVRSRDVAAGASTWSRSRRVKRSATSGIVACVPIVKSAYRCNARGGTERPPLHPRGWDGHRARGRCVCVCFVVTFVCSLLIHTSSILLSFYLFLRRIFACSFVADASIRSDSFYLFFILSTRP